MNWFRSKKHLLLSSLVCFTLEQGMLEGSCTANSESTYDAALASPTGCASVLSITGSISLSTDNALLNAAVGTSATPFNIVGTGSVSISGNGGSGARNLLHVNITSASSQAYISIDPSVAFVNGTVTVESELAGSTASLAFLGTTSYGSSNVTNYTIGQNGTLQFAVTGTVGGTFSLTDSTATILVNSGQTITASGLMSGTGGLNIPGPGNLTLSNIESYTGGTTVNGGAFALSGSGDISASNGLSLNGTSTFNISGITGASTTVQDLITSSGSTINLGTNKSLAFGTANSTTVAGSIIDTSGGGIVKQGSGTVFLTGACTFTGGSTVNNGTLAMSAGGTLLPTGAVTVNGVGIFDVSALTASSLSIGDFSSGPLASLVLGTKGLNFGTTNSTTIAGPIIGSGPLVKQGSGTSTISNANGLFTGAVSLNAGQITIANSTALGTGVLTMAGGTILSVNGGVSAANSVTLSGSAFIDVSSAGIGTLTGNLSGSGSLTKTGAYTLALSGSNTYSGGTTINAGTLALISGGTLLSNGSVTLNGGIFDISDVSSSGVTIGPLTTALGSQVVLGNKILSFGGTGSATIAGTIAGLGSIVKLGTGATTLTGSNTFSGGTTIDFGTLALSGLGSLLSTGSIVINGSSIFDISNLAVASTTVGDVTSVSGTTISLGLKNLTLGTANDTTIAGSITGGGSITKQGSGILTLSGNNSFTGGTTISAGTLAIGASDSLASTGSVTVQGSAILDISSFSSGLTIGDLTTGSLSSVLLGSNILSFGTSNSTTIAGTIGGAGSLIKLGSGTATFSNANTFEGGVNLSQGQITINDNEALGTGTLIMGVGTTLSIGALVNAENLVTLSGAATIDVSSGGPGTLSGILSGPIGALTKSGIDSLILTGANTYAGGTTINAGTLALSEGGALASGGTVTINGSSTFDISKISGIESTIGALITAAPSTVNLGGKTLIFGNSSNTTIAGLVQGTNGVLQKQGTGTSVLSNSNTFTGGVLLNAGQITMAADAALGTGTLTMAGGTTLGIGALINAANNIILSGAGTVDTSSGFSGTLSGNISGVSGSLIKTGANTLKLAGSNTYEAGTTVSAGTLALIGTGSLYSAGSVTVNAGSFDISELTTTGALIGDLTTVSGSTVVLGSNNLTFGTGNNTTIAGIVTGLGSLIKQGAGIATMTGANTFTGGLEINGGTVALAAPSGALASTGPVTVNLGAFDISSVSGTGTQIGDLSTASGTLVSLGAKILAFGTSNDTTIAGNITGTGSLTKNGTGTVTISNGNSFSGGVLLSAGEIYITNNTALGSGPLTMNATTTLSIGPGIVAPNLITLNGAVSVDVSNGGIGSLSGSVGGVGSLAKTGSNVLDLLAASTYSGGTIIDEGTLALVGLGSLAATGSVTLNAGMFDISGITPALGTTIGDLITLPGTTVNLGSEILTFGTGNSTTIAGSITGSGGFAKQGLGQATISAANTTLTGPVSLNAGEIYITNNTALGTNTVTMAAGTTLSLGSGISAANNIVLSGAVALDVSNGGIGSLSGNITGGIGSTTKTGSNTLALLGTNTYGNGTIISEGTLSLVAGGLLSSTGAVIVNGSSIFNIAAINAAGTQIGDLTTGALSSVLLGNKTLTFGTGNSTVIAGIIEGTGPGASLVKVGTGTATISNANTFEGGVSLDAGEILLGNNAGLGSGWLTMSDATTLSLESGITAANDIVLNGAVTLDVSMGGTGTLIGNIIGPNGSATKTGSNILALSGTNIFGNGTTINGGTLKLILNGSLSPTGSVTVNSGTFDISNLSGPSTTIGDHSTLVGTLVALGNKKLIFGTSHDTTIAGIISGGDGSILKQGSGAVTFMGANTFTGGVVVNSGEIALSSGGSFAPAGLVTLNGSSTFDVSGITPTSTTVGDLTTSLGSTLNLGAKQLIFGTGANTSLLGLVTGSGGSLAKNGNGTVLMAHANTFTGGFLLNAGKLLINDSNALGSGTLTTSDGTGFTLADGIVLENNIDLFSGNTNITVNDSNIAAISGNLTGAGGFIKEGSGTLLWEGVGNYSGTTAVGSGTLKLASGSSIQGPVAVASGAVLQSCGSSGRLLNAGTFILGCSDTTAYINGNAVFNGESTLQVGVGNSSHAALVINGELTIEPGSNVHFVVSSDYNRVNQHFTFVYSNGITGHFEPANILINSPLIVPIITQTGGDLSVGLDLANFSQMITDNNNAVAVGQAIYNLAVEDNPVGDALISSLIGLGRIGEIEDALDQMHPALYKGLTLSQENNAVRIQDTISYRFQQELNEVHCYQYRSKQESAEDPKENDLQRIQKQLKKKVKACEKPKKQTINLWVDGFGDWLGQGAIRFAGSPQLGYQINTGGVTLGLDGNFAKYFYAGAMGGYTGSSADWHDSQSKGTVDTGYAGLYFSGISDMFYGNLSVVGGWSHYSGHRSIIYPGVNETATNSHNGSQILTHAETGVNFGIKGISLRPFDAFDYIAQSEGGFTEKGAGIYNLDVQNTSAIMLRNELGMQFAGCMCFPSSRWTIAPKFSWVLESRTKGKGYVVEFEGTDLSFDITGYFPNRSLFSPGVLISGLMLKDRLSLDLYYNGAFGEKYSENNFGGQIRYGF